MSEQIHPPFLHLVYLLRALGVAWRRSPMTSFVTCRAAPGATGRAEVLLMSDNLTVDIRPARPEKRPTRKAKITGRAAGTSRSRMPGADRRASILEATAPIFAERGFYGATTRDLRSAAGITQPTVYLYFQDKQGLYRAVLEKQAQEVLTALLDASKPESRERDETTFLAGLADLLLGWIEGDQTALRLFLYGALDQEAGSRTLLCLHAFLTRQVQSRLAAGHKDDIERTLLAQCFVGLIFHFGLLHTLEGKWPSGVSREQIVNTVVHMVLASTAPGAIRRD